MRRRLFLLIISCFCSLWIVHSFSTLPSQTTGRIPSPAPLYATQATVKVQPPPWSFQASRLYYQFLAIPTDQARQYCPPCRHHHEKEDNNPLVLLSSPSFTLGGIFCIEYQDSPIGPYREVAFLSSLVARKPSLASPLPSIGAWASHIFVDSHDAALYGQEFWGLPATVLPIDFMEDATNDSEHGSLLLSDKSIQVSGWAKDDNDHMLTTTTISILDLLDISLPSFSGLLPITVEDGDQVATTSSNGTTKSPLLQYPLSIIKPTWLGFEPAKALHFNNDLHNNIPLQEVQNMLQGSRPLFSVGVENVKLVAGVPKVVE